jgi:hypothetical protein
LSGKFLLAFEELQEEYDAKAGVTNQSPFNVKIKLAAKRIGTTIFLFGFFLVAWLSNHQPSSCKGCESSSLLFYLFIHWLTLQLIMCLAIGVGSAAIGLFKRRSNVAP